MRTLIHFACAIGLIACNGSRNATTGEGGTNMDTGTEQGSTARNGSAATAPVIVYRTSTDHSDHVPVALSSDGKIVSYPHPTDVEGDVRPIDIGDGYLLDRRGIGTDVAYLDYTFAEYAALENAPGLSELEARIIDRDPLIEMYHCGTRADHSDPEKEMRSIVQQGTLAQRCKKLK